MIRWPDPATRGGRIAELHNLKHENECIQFIVPVK